MPDFTMCANEQCRIRNQCGRTIEGGAKPNPEWQSWANFTFTHYDSNGIPDCERHFWPAELAPSDT